MKTKFVLFLFFILSNITFSQTEKETKHTISLNLNFILDQWISRSNQSSIFQISPDHNIAIIYKYRSNNFEWRFGYGGLRRNEIDNNSLFVGGGTNVPIIKNLKTNNLLIGFQKTREVWKKWNFFYGIDLLLTNQEFNAIIEDDTQFFFPQPFPGESLSSELKRNSIGLGGFLGIQYFLSNRISIATELGLTINRTYSNRSSDEFLFLDPIFNSVEGEANIINDFNLLNPKVVQVNFHF